MKRDRSKRFELNKKEADLLRIKAKQTGLSESEYIRELIMNSQPVEAPPRQFYDEMGKLNRLVTDMGRLTDRIAVQTEEPTEYLDCMMDIYHQLQNRLVEIKRIVSSARYYAASAYEYWLHEVEEARRQGKAPPEMEDYEPRDRSRDIQDPKDPDLGWNALGITPPFLEAEESEETEGGG